MLVAEGETVVVWNTGPGIVCFAARVLNAGDPNDPDHWPTVEDAIGRKWKVNPAVMAPAPDRVFQSIHFIERLGVC